jgi:hypothetical protein
VEYGDSEEDGERLLNFLDDVRISSCRLIVSPADVAVSVSREIVLILVFFSRSAAMVTYIGRRGARSGWKDQDGQGRQGR